MRTLFLRRISMSKHGTFGVLIGEGFPMLSTLEPPDKGNEENVSCIPEGHYVCKRDDTGRYKYFQVTDVPNRTDIEFHEGNWVRNTKGCILLGQRFAQLSDKPYISSSRLACKDFMDALEGEDTFALIIQNSYLHGTINRPPVPVKYP